MARGWPTSFALIWILSACQVEGPIRLSRDEGTGLGGGRMGTPTGGQSSTSTGGAASASTGGLSASCDASVASTARDAAPPHVCDGGLGATSDPDTPPAHCVPPCVWELMKHCEVRSACSTQEYPGGIFGPNWVTCSPSNHVWKITTEAHVSSTDEYFLGECPCYTFFASLLGTTGGAWQTTAVRWYDGAGDTIAEGFVDTNTHAGGVVCGSVDSNGNPTGPTYQLDPNNPDCARWSEPACERGCCGAPPKVPVSDF